MTLLLVNNEKEEYTDRMNPDSLKVINGLIESSLKDVNKYDQFQFIRNGFFNVDVDSNIEEGLYIFNRIVPLKSAFRK